MSYPFNVRVYGLLQNNGQVLVSDEWIKGARITKFPGGGLEYGEDLTACLIREIQEEIGISAHSLNHFYTTEKFVESAWRKGEQIISVYFTFQVDKPSDIDVISEAFDGVGPSNDEARRWLQLEAATVEDLTLPIDKLVLEKLKNAF